MLAKNQHDTMIKKLICRLGVNCNSGFDLSVDDYAEYAKILIRKG